MGTHKKGIATPSATTGDKVQKYKWAEVHKHNKQEGFKRSQTIFINLRRLLVGN